MQMRSRRGALLHALAEALLQGARERMFDPVFCRHRIPGWKDAVQRSGDVQNKQGCRLVVLCFYGYVSLELL